MRLGKISRKTKETEISIELNLDGKGKSEIDTSVGFLNHMLELFAFHGGFDLKVRAKGDTEVDYHHLIEDLGITLGIAINQSLGDRKGIRRYGFASIPMDEALAQVSLDLGGRAYLVYNVPFGGMIKDIDVGLFEEFFRALVNNGNITLHINLLYGKDLHHIVEGVFKAFARALREAIEIEGDSIPSTKGTL